MPAKIRGSAATDYGHKKIDEFQTLYDKDQTITKTWLKMLVVREPFDRLLSAYRNKIEPNRTDYFGQISKRIAKHYGNSERPATFSEFLKFYIDDHYPNEHWESFASLAQPCKYDYNYILKSGFVRILVDLIQTWIFILTVVTPNKATPNKGTYCLICPKISKFKNKAKCLI